MGEGRPGRGGRRGSKITGGLEHMLCVTKAPVKGCRWTCTHFDHLYTIDLTHSFRVGPRSIGKGREPFAFVEGRRTR
jgi:hypothetical protein